MSSDCFSGTWSSADKNWRVEVLPSVDERGLVEKAPLLQLTISSAEYYRDPVIQALKEHYSKGLSPTYLGRMILFKEQAGLDSEEIEKQIKSEISEKMGTESASSNDRLVTVEDQLPDPKRIGSSAKALILKRFMFHALLIKGSFGSLHMSISDKVSPQVNVAEYRKNPVKTLKDIFDEPQDFGPGSYLDDEG